MIITNRKLEERILLNLGCGQTRPLGWINTDSSLNSLFQKYPIIQHLMIKIHKSIKYSTSNVIFMDLRYAWKFKDCSVDVVYASHVFEHLTLKTSQLFMNEAFRVLRPNGILRIVVPDLYQLAKNYVSRYEQGDEIASQEFLEFINLHKEGTYSKNRNIFVKILNFLQSYPHQHKYMYDALSIKHFMSANGFVDICESTYGESKYISEISQVEFTKEGVPSIYIESKKVRAL
ncbi:MULTISPECIES: class I SAM-dependent methyltransferase [Nostocales]|uniref:Methyltransferase domain-containing protein n=3 Tax=Nostocales TaxID=1161 RepID=A0A0C1R3Q5_9CYAN|nr:methyltransferase domain-containing protein [Tolypothrix bouteillei]KAF3889675.1 methyltransferase domain-containing protein [Tolypothrix bouteillei VB521301]